MAASFFLVGSDYVWPHSVNAIVSDQLKALGGEKVGEEYIFFGSSDVAGVVAEIKKAKPDVIFSEVRSEPRTLLSTRRCTRPESMQATCRSFP